jgi:hypothetical protein
VAEIANSHGRRLRWRTPAEGCAEHGWLCPRAARWSRRPTARTTATSGWHAWHGQRYAEALSLLKNGFIARRHIWAGCQPLGFWWLAAFPFFRSIPSKLGRMTGRQFYDWQTAGGADDVMRMVDALERAELPWCAIGGIAVNHWAAEPMVTRDVDFVVAVDEIDRAVAVLEAVGFKADRHEWSVNFFGRSQVSLQLSTEGFYRDFTARSVPADVHGILLRVASLEDTLAGKIKAWRTPERRASKAIKDLGDIARLIEAHPELKASLPADVIDAINR